MNSPDEHLNRLFDAYFDGSLDAVARQDLDQLLTSSARARQLFWERAGLEGALESWAASSRGESLAFPPAGSRPRPWRRHLPAISGWAAAAALVLAWVIESRSGESAGHSPPVAARTAGTPEGAPGAVESGTPVEMFENPQTERLKLFLSQILRGH